MTSDISRRIIKEALKNKTSPSNIIRQAQFPKCLKCKYLIGCKMLRECGPWNKYLYFNQEIK